MEVEHKPAEIKNSELKFEMGGGRYAPENTSIQQLQVIIRWRLSPDTIKVQEKLAVSMNYVPIA